MTVRTTIDDVIKNSGNVAKGIGAEVAQYAEKIAHGIKDVAHDTGASVVNAPLHVGVVYAPPSYIRVLKEKGFQGHNIIEPRTYFGDGLSFLTGRLMNYATLVGTSVAFLNYPKETAVAIGLGILLSATVEFYRRSAHENIEVNSIY